MKQLDKAKELVDGFYTMKFNENFILEQIRINFMTSLIQYTSTKDKSEIQSQLLSIKNLGLDHLYLQRIRYSASISTTSSNKITIP
ncbi:hypothetical protein DBP97_02145 [Lactobacillus helveticus]|nr:hypothetical protein [Lactobacillus helveticus]PTS36014.1 hypothetical protein DBP97_02145 [Lactobacillus helveticus]PTS37637.1 hypothetical protein DBQ05_03190 [Lactobacillus helveticus]PTV21403.1 hypothetical protein DB332_00570 [Lactobacillus helveticus]PTV32798.1 hypothetical protein DB334_01445 [Lactobacillus helveticus]